MDTSIPQSLRAPAPTGAAMAPAAPKNTHPMFDRAAYLQLDPQRDLMTSLTNKSSVSMDADMYLQEGITLDGTHYGVNIISTSGVVLIAPGARVLPSKKRPSRIIAKHVVIGGEAVMSLVQADDALALCDNSKLMADDVVYGGALAVTEAANLRVNSKLRGLASRERRAEALYKDAVETAAAEASSFDTLAAKQDAEIEKAAGLPEQTNQPRLAAVGGSQA